MHHVICLFDWIALTCWQPRQAAPALHSTPLSIILSGTGSVSPSQVSPDRAGHRFEAMLTTLHGVQFFFAVAGGGNGRSLVLVLTELTGMYCISSVLLIRKQLPILYRCCLHDLV